MEELNRNPIEELFEAFLEERRQGNAVTIESFAGRYPEDLAKDIRDLFPAIKMLEEIYHPNSVGLTTTQTKDICGEQFGDYEILSEIGRGGMGVVYHAQHRSLGKDVAIKVLPVHLASEDYKKRFLREARSAARLHHANIVPVFDFGVEGERYYYVMQLIRGQSLAALLRSARESGPGLARSQLEFTLTQAVPDGTVENYQSSTHGTGTELDDESGSDSAVRSVLTSSSGRRDYFRIIAQIGLQAAEGLSHAHSRKVIHRDIKPANLILDEHGHVWITDFGLAKSDEGEGLTRTGDILGTLRYLAPESLRGNSDALGDLCSLGLTLYELAALRPAYADIDRHVLLQRITESNPEALSTVCRSIPYDLETIIHKAIERDPNDRYRSAQELADDLRRFLNNQPITGRRTSWAGVMSRWSKRNPALAVSLMTILTGLLVVSLASTFAAFQFANLSENLQTALEQSLENEQAAQDAELESKQHLYEASIIAARTATDSKSPGQRLIPLEAIRRSTPLIRELGLENENRSELRYLAVKALSKVDLLKVWEAENRQAGRDPMAVAYPDSNLYITSRIWPAEQLHLRRVSDQQLLATTPKLDSRITRFFYHESSRVLAAILYGPDKLNLQCWRFQADTVLKPFFNRNRRIPLSATSAGFDIAEKAAVCGVLTDPRTLEIVSLESGDTLNTFQFSSDGVGVCLSANGEKAVVWSTSPQRGSFLVDLRSGAVSQLAGVFSLFDADLSDDGRLLATVHHGETAKIWNLDAGKVLTECHAESTIDTVDLHPSKQFLVTQSWDRQIRLWDRSGEMLLSFPGVAPRFSPDGGHLSYRNGDRIGYMEFFGPDSYSAVAYENGGHTVGAELSSHGFWSIFANGLAVYDSSFETPIGSIISHRRVASDGLLLPDGSALLVTADEGLTEWPIERRGSECIIGPPRLIELGFVADGNVVSDISGNLIAVGGYQSFAVLRKYPEGWQTVKKMRQPGGGARVLSLAPDGTRLVVGNYGFSETCIFDTASWEITDRFALSDGARFDGSGQQLIFSSAFCPTVVKTSDNSRQTWPFAGDITSKAISRTRNIGLASDVNSMCVRLIDFADNKSLLQLPMTNARNTPDDCSFLDHDASLAVSAYRRLRSSARLSIWDLRSLRSELCELNLDWDTPPTKRSALDFDDPATEFAFHTYPPDHNQLQVDPKTGVMMLEAPYLVASARESNNPPELLETILDKSPRGLNRFSGETRLRWKPRTTNEELFFDIDVPSSGTYDLRLSMAMSPRRGICRVLVNGQQVGEDLDRYTALFDQLLPPPFRIGEVKLNEGRNTVALQVVGKHAQAHSNFLGIDNISLIPVHQHKK